MISSRLWDSPEPPYRRVIAQVLCSTKGLKPQSEPRTLHAENGGKVSPEKYRSPASPLHFAAHLKCKTAGKRRLSGGFLCVAGFLDVRHDLMAEGPGLEPGDGFKAVTD